MEETYLRKAWTPEVRSRRERESVDIPKKRRGISVAQFSLSTETQKTNPSLTRRRRTPNSLSS